MKRLIGSDFGIYDFDPTARTVTFFDTPAFSINQVLLITNVTAGKIIYNFADSSLSGTLSKNVITLVYDTSLMKTTDNLQIYIDFPDSLSFDSPDDLTNISKSGKTLGTSEISELLDGLLDNRPGLLNVNVSPLGLGAPGQQPASMSVPVALANEHIKDAVFQNVVQLGKLGVNACSPDGTVLDCLQYRSIALQIQTVASSAGALAFEGSNDGINFVAVSMYDAASLTSAPVASLTLAASVNRFFIAPLYYRYFRARVSTIISGGIVSLFTILRMVTFSAPQAQNINQYGGTNVVTGGIGGLPGVGGNIAPGTAATANPVPIGGVDSAGKTRRVLTDVSGDVAVNGPDPVLGQRLNPVKIVDGFEIGMSSFDLLNRILIELRSISYYLQEMPLILNKGKQFSDDVASFSDELRIQN
jgi:hypothetical protein